MTITEWGLRAMLWWQSRSGPITKFLDRKDYRRPSFPERAGNVRVAAVQMRMELVEGPEEWAERLYRQLLPAVENGAQMVLFPESTGTPLLGLFPDLRRLIEELGDVEAVLEEIGGGRLEVADLLHFMGPATGRIYEAVFSRLARGFHLHLGAGTAYLPGPGGRVYSVFTLFGPDGRILARQRKIHPLPWERSWGVSGGADLTVQPTALGRLGLAVFPDERDFEVFRMLRLQGAEIVLLPSADFERAGDYADLSGLWARTQESQVYAVRSAMVGSLLGRRFSGRSAILAPRALSPSGDGLLAEAGTTDREEVIWADLDLERLADFRREHPLRWNLGLYRRYLPEVYREEAERAREETP